MPKTLKITGNNLKLRYGWFPPIPDTENAANQYHGGADFFKNRGNFDVFRKILKENMGFDFEADPEDVGKRILFTSKLGRSAFGKYQKRMQEISRMPASQEKITEIQETAQELERALYHQMAKGRFVFIPLGETEPRQLRYNSTSGEFQISHPFAGMKEHQEISEQLLPKVNGKVITQKQERAPEIVDPGEFEEKIISKPKPPAAFKMKLRPMPEPEGILPIREKPEKPKELIDVSKSKSALIQEEYERILKASKVEEPVYKQTENAPVFRLNKPNPVKKPVPVTEDLKEPVKPAIEAEIEKVEAELKALKAPEFPYENYVRTTTSKPEEVEKPYEPVLELPDPPQPPEYIELQPPEPVFQHPTLPTFEIITPDWRPDDPPKVPDYPELPVEPEKPVLRERPVEPVKPSWFRRFFNWSLIDEYNTRHLSWEEDDRLWQEESRAMPQRLLDFEAQQKVVTEETNERLRRYQAEVRDYMKKFDKYNLQLAEYQRQVADLDAENDANYDDFKFKTEEYERVRKELGPKYDEDYAEFLKVHEAWEKQTEPQRLKNEAMEKEYKESASYKEYEQKKDWYYKNVKPYSFMHNEFDAIKENLRKDYEEKREKYDQFVREKTKYDEEVKWVNQFHNEKDFEINGKNPDYEENKDVRLSQKLLENAEVNAKHDKELKDFNLKKDILQQRYNELAADPEHVRYAKEKEAYDENERLKKPVIVKKPYEDPEEYKSIYDADYEGLKGPEKAELDAKLDNALKEEKQLLPSEYKKMVADEMKQSEENKNINDPDDSEYDEEFSADGNEALNYTFVDDLLMHNEDEPEAGQDDAQREPQEDEIKLSRYEYELQKYNEYEKDLKYYNLMEKRYQEKLSEWEKQYEANEEWNNNLESKKMDYKEYLEGFRKTAVHNVELTLEQNKIAQEDYEQDLKNWEEEKAKHDLAVRDAKNNYEWKLFQWKKEKEEYDKALNEHNQEEKDYETAVKIYNQRVEDYKKSYEDYLKQLSKFENDTEMNKVVDERNIKSEEDYNKLVEKHVQKVTAKNPDLKDYELNKLDYANGNLQWQMDLMYRKNPTLEKWQEEMKSEGALDKYFVNHARKENDYIKYKSKCKNIKEPDPVEQQNYEAQLSYETKYSNYPEDARPFLYLLDAEEEKLINVINRETNVDYEFYKNAATLIMYNKVVREELGKNNPNPLKPRAEEFSRYLDKEHRKTSLSLMRKDKILDKTLRNEFNENVKMTRGETKDYVNDFMKRALLRDDYKFRGMYHNRYENPKKTAITDPVTFKKHDPEVVQKKGAPTK